MELRVLGQLQVVEGRRAIDLGGARQRRLLGALAVEPDSPLSVDILIDRVWDDGEQPSDGVRTLRTLVSRLRIALPKGEQLIATRPGGYALELAANDVTTDTARFEALLGQLRRATADPASALALTAEALELWRGPAFVDVAHLSWASPTARRLEELRRATEEDRFDALLAMGRASDTVAELEVAVAAEPLRERRQGQLMVALYRCGRQAEALRAYDRYRSQLATETGLEPSEALRSLEARVLAADPSLHASPTGPAAQRQLRSYVLGDQLGEGAFAVVWQAAQPSVGRDVAIKQIRAELANRPEFVRRFEAEAHLVARLEHPHVVPLYDYWREPDSAYLVMRLLRGGTLQARIDREGGLPLRDCTRLATEVGSALAAAHRVGVVHRDVKPGNVFCDDEGRFYLGDFGIALDIAQSVDPEASLSAGSPAYASPEQLRREPVGVAADIHALGVTLYEALTGRIPFPQEPNQAALLRRQLNDPIPPPRDARPELPPGIDAVIARATAKQPSDRYPRVEDFVDAFIAAADAAPSGPVAGPARRSVATIVGFGAANPYKGLRAFTEADTGDFFGRDRLVGELLERLRRPGTEGRVVTVVGPSGSGKSSVVRAGLLPALRGGAVDGSERWFTVGIVPSRHPFEELEAALLRVAVNPPERLLDQLADGPRGIARAVKRVVGPDHGELLLVIDQFEELFTLCADDAERTLFLSGLAEAVRDPQTRLRLVITVRADFVDRPLRVAAFAPLVKASAVMVTPLAPDELERAITEPALRAGCELEAGLVAQIVADVADQPGALPLLQYTLTELYERRVSGLLTLAAYQQIGGLTGALARRADELTDALDATGQAAVRRLFGRLVSLGDGSEDTRRRVERTELAGVPDHLIDRFGAARLLSFDQAPISREPTVEVAHEALIRQWPRLRAWLDADRDGLRIHRHLTGAAAAWGASGNDSGELYRGGRLEAAESWAAERPDELNAGESAFLAASVEQRRTEQRAAERGRRRLRRALAAVATVAALALVAGALAFQQRGSARDAAERADRAAAEAETRRLVADASAIAGENRDVALLLASEAYQRDPGPRTLAGLQRVLTSTGPYLGTIGAGKDFVAGGYLADGSVVGVTADTVYFYDPVTWQQTAAFPIGAKMFKLNYFPAPVFVGADVVAVGTEDGTVVLIRGGTARRLSVSPVTVRAVQVKGNDLLVGGIDGNVRLVDATTGQARWVSQVLPERSFREVMGDASWSALAPSLVPMLTTGEETIFQRGPTAVTYSADGSVLVLAGPFLRRLDSATGAITNRFVLETGLPGVRYTRPLRFVAERPNGNLVVAGTGFAVEVSASFEQVSLGFPPTGRIDANVFPTALVLDRSGTPWFGLSNGQVAKGVVADARDPAERFASGAARVDGLVLSAEGGRLLMAGAGGLVNWSTDGRQLLARAVPRGEHVEASISFDGLQVLPTSTSAQRPSLLYDLGSDPPTRRDTTTLSPIGAHANDMDPRGRFIGEWDRGGLTYYDARTLTRLAHLENASYIAHSTDGRWAAIMSTDTRTVRVYDTVTWQQASPDIDLSRWKGAVGGLNTLPTLDTAGTRLLVSMRDGVAVVFDTKTWQPVTEIRPEDHGGAVSARFSSDGSLLVTRGLDRSISVRDGTSYQVLSSLEGGTSVSDTLSVGLYVGPDNQYLLTRDAEPRLWHLPTATLIGSFPHDEGMVAWGNDLGDELRLVTIVGAYALSWNLDVTAWPAIACKAAGRNLTQAEWDQFGPRDQPYHPTCAQWAATT